jgi:hypothetical protein
MALTLGAVLLLYVLNLLHQRFTISEHSGGSQRAHNGKRSAKRNQMARR